MKIKAQVTKLRSSGTGGGAREIAGGGKFGDISGMLDQTSSTLKKALADDARVDRQAVAIALAIVSAFTIVNALSGITEYQRIGVEVRPQNLWIYEISSLIIHVPLLFSIAWFTRRFPPSPHGWARLGAIYAAAAVAFSAIHIIGMVMIRKAAFFLFFGETYHFLSRERRLAVEALYEFRKDVLGFALFVGLFALWRSRNETMRELEAAKREASETQRLTLKCGGRTIYLDADAIDYAKAAGNYVEIAAAGKTHLARITMAALEEQLAGAGAPVVRAHRSWLVNKSKIAEIVPAGDGDVTIRLKSGAEAPGSRRYRERLGA